VLQRPCDPDLFAGRDDADSAVDIEPVGTAQDPRPAPAVGFVELGEQDQKAVRRGRNMALERRDLVGQRAHFHDSQY
jgi:hypothetical protein